MTKLARTRVRACKGDQSWSLAMPEDRPARRVVICTVSTLRPAYLHTAEHSVTAHVCGMQVCRTQRRNRADHDPARLPVLRYGQGPALIALASPDTRFRQLCHSRSVTGSCTAAKVPDFSHLQNGFYLELRSDQGLDLRFQIALFHAT